MRNKELIRLPLNRTFDLTNGNYTYLLRKHPRQNDSGVHYVFMLKGGNRFTDSFSVFERLEDTETTSGTEVQYLKLTYSASEGPFWFSGDFYMPNSYSKETEWQILTEMNLEKYLKKQFGINKQQPINEM